MLQELSGGWPLGRIVLQRLAQHRHDGRRIVIPDLVLWSRGASRSLLLEGVLQREIP